MVVQEETRLKQQGHHSVHLISKEAHKKWKKPKKSKNVEPPKNNGPPQGKKAHERGQNCIKCRFCKKFRHVKRDFHKRSPWFEKKDFSLRMFRIKSY